jgi:hypothetical protein
MYWLRTALTGIVAFLPDLVAGLVVLAIGAFLGWVAARITRPLCHRAGLDRLLARHRLIDRADTASGSGAVATALFWVIFAMAGMQACRAFRLDSVANAIGRVLAYVPHAFAATVIFLAALVFGDWVRDRMRRAATETVAPGAVRAGILAVGVFMGLRELMIAPQIVTIAFTLVMGTIAVATAISFGLGSRDVAGRMAARWYRRGIASAEPPEPLRESDERPPTH